MKLRVMFDLPNITDPNSEEADETIEILQDELKCFAMSLGAWVGLSHDLSVDWHNDDATGEQE